MKQPIPRRKFIQQAALGAAATPFFLEALKTGLAAQENNKQQIFWLEGQSAGLNINSSLTDAKFLRELNADYQYNNFQSLSSLNLSDKVATEKDKYLIFEGHFNYGSLLGKDRAILEKILLNTRCVLLVGAAASFDPNGFLPEIIELYEIPYMRLSGVPVHNHHILGALSHLLLYGFPEIDAFRRPKLFYEKVICDYCEYRGDLVEGNFVNYFGEKEGCLYKLGCKGPFTYNSCPVTKWNESSQWCVGAGAPCSGCSEKSYPDHSGLGLFSNSAATSSNYLFKYSETISKILFSLTVAGAAVHAVSLRAEKMGDFAFPDSQTDQLEDPTFSDAQQDDQPTKN